MSCFQVSQTGQGRPTSGRASLPFYFFFPPGGDKKEAVPWMDVPCSPGVATSHHMQLPARRVEPGNPQEGLQLGQIATPN